jgi:hypothetical protein
MVAYWEGWVVENFKTGALNHSATLPLLRHQPLSATKIKNGSATGPNLDPAASMPSRNRPPGRQSPPRLNCPPCSAVSASHSCAAAPRDHRRFAQPRYAQGHRDRVGVWHGCRGLKVIGGTPRQLILTQFAVPLKARALNSYRPRMARAWECGCGRINKSYHHRRYC